MNHQYFFNISLSLCIVHMLYLPLLYLFLKRYQEHPPEHIGKKRQFLHFSSSKHDNSAIYLENKLLFVSFS